MSKTHANRFYKNVSVAEHESGYVVQLDGRTLKTPGKHPLIMQKSYQAECVAAEWDAQIEQIKPETMPCTRLLNVACEQTPDNRDGLIAEVRKYAGTDLLCYRADAPQELSARQLQTWDPVLDWAQHAHDISLKVTSGISAISQDEAELDKVAAFAARQDDVMLTLLTHFTAVFGSSILSIATMERHLEAEQALTISRLDELFQIERWGEDEEAQIRTANIRAETLALSQLIRQNS